jgi:hypothetical protein
MTDDTRPEWWTANEEIRRQLELPPYEPPTFEYDVPVHEVRNRYDEINIQFIAFNAEYLDDWEVRIDGAPAFSISRYRDRNGNTVFGMTANAFERRVESFLESAETGDP